MVAVADEPADHQDFLEAFTGAQAKEVDGGFSIALPRGVIEVVAPGALLNRFGVKSPDCGDGARLAALRLTVADPSLLQAVPELDGLGGLDAGEATVIGSEDAMGAVLVFEPAAGQGR